MDRIYKIKNIHESSRHKGIIYAELHNETERVIVATLDYIFDVIKERSYLVSNITYDKFNNIHIKDL